MTRAEQWIHQRVKANKNKAKNKTCMLAENRPKVHSFPSWSRTVRRRGTSHCRERSRCQVERHFAESNDN